MFRLMIADDEPIVRKGLEMLVNWEEMGCHIVYTAVNGQDVLNSIAGTNPDIIITDIKMPEVDGIEIAKYIHENGLPIKVIFLTAYADFSYAKMALEYGVVDYVTKTGAFEGLEKAVIAAKNLLNEERNIKNVASDDPQNENFFKSLIDGSLYDETDINIRASGMPVELFNYVTIVFRFSQIENLTHERKKNINASLINFFGMAFKEQKPLVIPVKRNQFCVILNDVNGDYMSTIESCCFNIVDIMLNFMKLDIIIGVSGLHKNMHTLKIAYEEALDSLSNHSLNEDSEKILFYAPTTSSSISDADIGQSEQYTDDLCRAIIKGNKEDALGKFHRLVKFQQEKNFSFKHLKNNGLYIISSCKRYLSRYNSTLSGILELKQDAAKLVLDSFTLNEYTLIMNTVIGSVASFNNRSASQKSLIIYDCEQLIKKSVESNLNVTDISRKIGVSPSYLSRIFKEKTGSTIIQALNEKKVERAKEYLRETDLKIYEIADKLGFENTTYFSHFFKKYCSISPLAYRQADLDLISSLEGV